ncbi:MAG TPA: hypothetical protein VFQ35_27045 [Polyangiaceae bacterium]|nr:hypothetical protein [Polyangiaceae bacterium]
MKAKGSLRNSHSAVLLALACLAGVACGGRTEGGETDPTDSSAGGASNATPGSGGATSGQGSNGSGFGSTTLPPCVLGVEQWLADACDYYAEGRCYEKKLEACACVCPRNVANTTCLSSFDVPARVTCF